MRVVISTRGARVTSWTLKHYQDLQTKQPLDLVPSGLPGRPVRPFELRVDDESANARLRGALFRPGEGARDGRVDATRAAQTVTFEYRDAAGLEARKSFTFEPNTYLVGFDADVSVGGRPLNPTILWGPGLGDLRAGGSSYEQKPQGMVFRGREVDRIDAGEVADGQALQEGTFAAAGVDDLYFISLALPVRPVRVQYEAVVVPGPGGDPKQSLPYMAWASGRRSRPRGCGSTSARRTSTRSSRSTPGWSRPSTSASSTGLPSRCSTRSTGSTATSATTAGRSSS